MWGAHAADVCVLGEHVLGMDLWMNHEKKVWLEPIKAESGEEKKKPYKLNYYYHYHYCDGVQFECVLCELLPEDTDEPERLELLDAAIPTRFTARFTPVWPRCARSGSSPAVPPFHSHTSSVLHLLTALTVSRLGAAPEHPGSRPPRVRLADPPLPCPPACLPACLGSRCASVCAELPLQHTLKVPRIKIVKTGRTLRGSGSLEHTGQTGSVGLDACHAEIGYGFHVPL